MNKLAIAIDCDDVIVPTASLILAHYNKKYGTTIALKDFYSNDLSVWDAPDNATAVNRVEMYLMSEEYQNAEPFSEAVKAIQALSRWHELHIITSRPDFLADATTRMLAQYLPGIFKTVQFTNFFGQKSRSKAEVCQQLAIDLLIDDHLHHAKAAANCGVRVLLFGDYPWNESSDLPRNIQRVKSWQDISSLLLPT